MHTHTLWAARVAAGTVLPDKRLSARLACLLETFAERPNDAIPQAAGSWGQAKGIYRFLANQRVQPAALQQGLTSDTARQCLDQTTVLVVQDTTSLNLTGCHVLPELGPIGSGNLAQGVLGRVTITVPRSHGTPARTATVEMRALTTTLRPDRAKYPHAWPLTWTLVEVWEPNPAPEHEALHWLLWTREPATTLTEVQEVVRQYTCRWPIEEYHLTLKSGCRIEALRLESWDSLEKAIVMYTSVAARIVALRDRAQQEPNAPATVLLSEDECAVLVAKFGQGRAVLRLTLGQAVLWIGRLGGHLNRQRDGMPGVRTLWRGLRDLTLLVEGWRVARRLENRCG